MKVSMWALSWLSELKEAPLSALLARIENQISTWVSHEARVGVKWKRTLGWRASQRSFFGLWVLRLSRMTWISRPGWAATMRFMKSRNSTRRRRLYCRPVTLPVAMSKAANRGRRAVPRIVVRLAGERAAVRQLEIALAALQRLDR